jgi:hypothetical protein
LVVAVLVGTLGDVLLPWVAGLYYVLLGILYLGAIDWSGDVVSRDGRVGGDLTLVLQVGVLLRLRLLCPGVAGFLRIESAEFVRQLLDCKLLQFYDEGFVLD